MADRYWVANGATARTWNDAAYWSTTSGGAGGSAVPTSADDVYFDANGYADCTGYALFSYCASIDFTGYTGAFSGTLNLLITSGGAVTLASGGPFTATGVFCMAVGEEETVTFTSNGVTHAMNLIVNNIDEGGTFNFADAYVSTGTITISQGNNAEYSDFATGGYNITAKSLKLEDGGVYQTLTATLGSSTITLTGSGVTVLDLSGKGGTIALSASSADFKLTHAFTGTTFEAGGNTFNDIWLTGGGASWCYVTGGGTCDNFKVDTPPSETRFEPSKTFTVTTWTGEGTSGNLVKIISNTTTNATLAKAGGGTISLTYMSVDYITGSPADTWYMDANSTDGGHNSQIYFAGGATSIKTVFGTPIAEIKTIMGVPIADVKSFLGVSNVS